MKDISLMVIIIAVIICFAAIAITNIVHNSSKLYEPSAIQILATMEEVEARMILLNAELKKACDKAGITGTLMDKAIQAWRNEVNNYNDAFPEEIVE